VLVALGGTLGLRLSARRDSFLEEVSTASLEGLRDSTMDYRA
jgi:hypothetical protein